MAKTKRSFLQRLIGKEEGDPRMENRINFNSGYDNEMGGMGGNMNSMDNRNVQPDYRPNEYSDQNMDMADSFQEEDSEQIDQVGIGSQPITNEPKGEGDWVTDQEGQLTIDVYQTDSDIVIKSTIAGVKPENLDVQINNDMVTIKGERVQEDEIKEDDYYYQECYWGTFSRSIILPVDIQANKAEATLKNGILTIRLPKASSAKARKIQVRGF